MSSEDRTYERTLYEARLDVEYEARLQELHARLYRRIRVLLVVLTLFAGSTAFVAAFGQNGIAAGIAGAVITCLSFLDVAFDFAGKAAAHEAQRCKCVRLLAKGIGDLTEFDRRYQLLRLTEPGHIEALRKVAHNDVLRSTGRNSYAQPLGFGERFMKLIA